jgi:hypothetical protein
MSERDVRLTLLERLAAQHAERLDRVDAILEELRESNRQQGLRLAQHEDQMAQQRLTHRRIADGFEQLQAALLAIKDLLDRGQNGH